MKLILEYAPNPDLMNGQGNNGSGFWGKPVDPRKMELQVKTLKLARKKFTAWIARNELGSGNMTRRSGLVYDGDKIVARVSYNGRVFTPGEWPNCKEIKT